MAITPDKKKRTSKWMSLLDNPDLNYGEESEPTNAGGFAGNGTSDQEYTPGQNSNLMRQVQLNTDSKYNPLFSDSVNTGRVVNDAMAVAATPEPELSTATGAALNTMPAETADQKLLRRLSNTNPQPRSLWRRLLEGVVSGAAQITPNDTGGQAIGRILGGSVQAIPAVDAAKQIEQQKAKAQQQYQIDRQVEQNQAATAAAANKQRNEERELAIKESTLKASAESTRLLNAAKLRDDKRQEADQYLKILAGTPKDDMAERKRLAKFINDEYGVKVGERYGEKEEKFLTIYDQNSGQYIRATQDGTPVLDPKGQPIVVRSESVKGAEDEAEGEVPPVMQGALRAQAIQEVRDRFGKDNPKVRNLDDAAILSDDKYGKYVTDRLNDLMQEAGAKRKQEVSKRTAEKKKGPVKPEAKAAPAKTTAPVAAPKGSFDFRNYVRLPAKK